MKVCAFSAAACLLLVSCSTLPVPGSLPRVGSDQQAEALLRKSARKAGDPWLKYSLVEVSYAGEWSFFATKIQPVLTDPAFRHKSVEIYDPRAALVRQIHSGPDGSKSVVRSPRSIDVEYNGRRSSDHEVEDAAALVADAYTIFLFGPSWLAVHGSELGLSGEMMIDGDRCLAVGGTLSPGLGSAKEDHFIAWISAESGLLRRFQFTLNGLASTQGADVDVVFSEFRKAPDGSIWPSRFVEHIQRPLVAKAHEWRMTSLKIDGRVVWDSRGDGSFQGKAMPSAHK